MMNIEHPMLSAEGRTSTSANHLANLAKEYYQNLESKIKSQSLVTRTVTIVGQNGFNTLTTGVTDLEPMKKAIKEIGQCKALIAYLREGIKAKKELIEKVSDYVSKEQQEHSISRPVRPSFITDEDVINSWPLEKRMRYYALEAKAATIGDYIHPKGAFAQQREIFHNSLSGKSELKERENYVLIYENRPTIDLTQVETVFFELQSKHREIEAELNSLKTEIKDAVQADKIQKEAEYKTATQAWNAKTLDLVNRDNLKRIEMNKIISKYKIVIPDNLKDIIAQIENL